MLPHQHCAFSWQLQLCKSAVRIVQARQAKRPVRQLYGGLGGYEAKTMALDPTTPYANSATAMLQPMSTVTTPVPQSTSPITTCLEQSASPVTSCVPQPSLLVMTAEELRPELLTHSTLPLVCPEPALHEAAVAVTPTEVLEPTTRYSCFSGKA